MVWQRAVTVTPHIGCGVKSLGRALVGLNNISFELEKFLVKKSIKLHSCVTGRRCR